MALAIDRVVDVKVLGTRDGTITVDDHEVAATAIPANARTHGAAGIDLGFYLLKGNLSGNAYKVVRPRQRTVKKPRDVTGAGDRSIAAPV